MRKQISNIAVAKPISLDTLPQAIQCNIFAHLNLLDILPLTRVNRELHNTLHDPSNEVALSLRQGLLARYPDLPQSLSVVGLAKYPVSALAKQRNRVMQSNAREGQKADELITLYSSTGNVFNRTLLLQEVDAILRLPFFHTPHRAEVLSRFLQHNADIIEADMLPVIRQKILATLHDNRLDGYQFSDYGKSEALKALYEVTQSKLTVAILIEETETILSADIEDQLFIATPLRRLYELGQALLDESIIKSFIASALNSPIRSDYYKEIIINSLLDDNNKNISTDFISDMTNYVRTKISYQDASTDYF